MIKISPIRIILAHWRTFGDADGGHKVPDVFWFYLFPCLMGWVYWFLLGRFHLKALPSSIWSGSLTVAAIFIPLIFTVIATLLSFGGEYSEAAPEKKLLRQVVDSSSYVILMAIVLGALIFACDWYYDSGSPRKIGGAIFVGLLFHIGLTTLMVLRRFHCLAESVLSKKGK